MITKAGRMWVIRTSYEFATEEWVNDVFLYTLRMKVLREKIIAKKALEVYKHGRRIN